MLRRPLTDPWIRRSFLICLLFSIILVDTLAIAVPMQNDPNGFEGIPWGTPYEEVEKKSKIKMPAKVKSIRGKLNVPRERFHLRGRSQYLWAGLHFK